MAARAGGSDAGWLERLRNGIETVAEDYDVVVLDPPPALGMISLNVLTAANCLIVPTPPALYDFLSTVTFFRMMEQVMESIERVLGRRIHYQFVKILISKYDETKTAQVGMARMMRQLYGDYVLQASLKNSAEIDNAGVDLKTVFELDAPTTSRQVYTRCLGSLTQVCREIEVLVRSTWPSHQDSLVAEGHIVD